MHFITGILSFLVASTCAAPLKQTRDDYSDVSMKALASAAEPLAVSDASVAFSFPTSYKVAALSPGSVYDAFLSFSKGAGNRWTFGACDIGLYQVKPDSTLQFVLNVAEGWTTFVEMPEVTTLEWQVPTQGVLPAVPGLYKLQATCGVFDYTAANSNGDANTDDEQIVSQSDTFGIDNGGLY